MPQRGQANVANLAHPVTPWAPRHAEGAPPSHREAPRLTARPDLTKKGTNSTPRGDAQQHRQAPRLPDGVATHEMMEVLATTMGRGGEVTVWEQEEQSSTSQATIRSSLSEMYPSALTSMT